jgi:hypothetical protein
MFYSAAPVAPPEPPVNPATQPQVGLATYISTNLQNAPGKKRGRGATSAPGDEPVAGRLKTGLQQLQASQAVSSSEVILEAPVGAVTETNAVGMTEKPLHSVTANVNEAQPPIHTQVKFSSADIADLFATPGAKKILGVGPKANSFHSRGSPSSSEVVPSISVTDVQGQCDTTEARTVEEGLIIETSNDSEDQLDLGNAASEAKEDQAFLQAAQSSGLISLTG